MFRPRHRPEEQTKNEPRQAGAAHSFYPLSRTGPDKNPVDPGPGRRRRGLAPAADERSDCQPNGPVCGPISGEPGNPLCRRNPASRGGLACQRHPLPGSRRGRLGRPVTQSLCPGLCPRRRKGGGDRGRLPRSHPRPFRPGLCCPGHAGFGARPGQGRRLLSCRPQPTGPVTFFRDSLGHRGGADRNPETGAVPESFHPSSRISCRC